MSDGSPRDREPAEPSAAPTDPSARNRFLAVLLVWLILPLALYGSGGQDAAALLTAGDLVGHDPSEVYQGEEADALASDEYRDSFCSIHPPVEDCASILLVFSSPPAAVPILAALQVPSPAAAVLLMRLIGAGALAAGMWLLWRRLTPQSPSAPAMLTVTALLLTPFAFHPIGLGQNTPLLFLLACLGVRGTERGPKGPVVGLIWAVATAFKSFPLALGAVLLLDRRWRPLIWGVGALAALTALAWLMGGPELFDGFRDQLGTNSGQRILDEANGSFSRLLHDVAPSLSGAEGLTPGFLALRVLVAIPLLMTLLAIRDPDTRWAFASVALLVLFPLVTWHYLWLGLASVAVAMSERARDRAAVAALPALAALFLAGSLVQMRWGYSAWVQAPLLIACCVLTAMLAERRSLRSLRPSLARA